MVEGLIPRKPEAEVEHQKFLKRCQDSLDDLSEIEQLVVSAMTNNGEYQVENAGEHATEIARTLIFNGFCKRERIATVVREYLNTNVCDICYEDDCGGEFNCTKGKGGESCECHTRVDEAKAKLDRALEGS